MVLLNALVVDIVFETVRLIFIAAVMICAIFLGKKLRDHSDAKKEMENEASSEK